MGLPNQGDKQGESRWKRVRITLRRATAALTLRGNTFAGSALR